jgi:hypothetical protein
MPKPASPWTKLAAAMIPAAAIHSRLIRAPYHAPAKALAKVARRR